MGLRIEEVPLEEREGINEFFERFTVNEFVEFFPTEMAQFAREHLEKQDFIYGAHLNGELVGAMVFTIQGGVGQLAAIQVNNKLGPLKRLRIRKAMLRRFIEACKEHGCHACFMWIPHQYVDLIKYYMKEGFERLYTARNLWYRNDFILMGRELDS